MKLPGYRNCSAGGVFCAPSASSAEEFDRGTDFSIHDSEGDVMATATQSAHGKELDTKQRSSTSRHFEEELRQRVVGQNEAVQALVDLY
jgi:ATP-dependent Clp protease ATP-binding subunit ClpA